MLTTIESTISRANDDLTARLDDLESSLPAIPSKVLAASRAGARHVNDTVASVVRNVTGRADTVGSSVATSAKTASGQMGAQARRAASAATAGAKTTAGQVRAEAGQSATTVRREVEAGLDDAQLAMDPDDLATLTKSELYDRAQDLDIEGRSSMTKAELVRAIQSA